jgi:hypothetical protein
MIYIELQYMSWWSRLDTVHEDRDKKIEISIHGRGMHSGYIHVTAYIAGVSDDDMEVP